MIVIILQGTKFRLGYRSLLMTYFFPSSPFRMSPQSKNIGLPNAGLTQYQSIRH